MAAELDDARHKLGRAYRHLADLQNLFGLETAGTDGHSVATYYDPEDRCHYAFLQLHSSFDHTLAGLILGDFINNARGSLDMTAWQLARQRLGREPTEKQARSIQFPIARNAAMFANSSVSDFVSTTAFAEMGNHQPPPGAAGHPLALLNWISKRDKHRVLVSSFTSRHVTNIGFGSIPGLRLARHEEIVPGDEMDRLMRRFGHLDPPRIPVVRLFYEPAELAADAQVETEAEVPIEIGFGGPTGNFGLPEIEAIYKSVEHIVGCFDRFF